MSFLLKNWKRNLASIFPNLTKVWNQIWFSHFDPTSMCICRVAFGVLIIFYYLFISFTWIENYKLLGSHILLGYHSQNVSDAFRMNIIHYTQDAIPFYMYWWFGFVFSIFFTMGFMTRFSALILFIMQSSIVNQNPMLANGEDYVIRMFLLWAMFMPLGYRFSLDQIIYKKKNKQERKQPLIWSTRAFQINFLLIYAFSVLNKILDDPESWLINGDAIYLTMTSEVWSHGFWPELTYIYFYGLFSKVATYGTLLVEGLFPILAWFPKTRLVHVLLLIFFHLCIALLLKGVAFFSIVMVCGLLSFISPKQWKLVRKFCKR